MLVGMTTWKRFEMEAPELAAPARARFEATKHHVLATLRRDGSPRVSASEVDLWRDELVLGSMFEAHKARDLQRDPRCAVHANPGDDSTEGDDVKLAGRAVEADDDIKAAYVGDAPETPQPFHLFTVELAEVVLTGLHPDGDRLVIRRWRPGAPIERFERR